MLNSNMNDILHKTKEVDIENREERTEYAKKVLYRAICKHDPVLKAMDKYTASEITENTALEAFEQAFQAFDKVIEEAIKRHKNNNKAPLFALINSELANDLAQAISVVLEREFRSLQEQPEIERIIAAKTDTEYYKLKQSFIEMVKKDIRKLIKGSYYQEVCLSAYMNCSIDFINRHGTLIIEEVLKGLPEDISDTYRHIGDKRLYIYGALGRYGDVDNHNLLKKYGDDNPSYLNARVDGDDLPGILWEIAEKYAKDNEVKPSKAHHLMLMMLELVNTNKFVRQFYSTGGFSCQVFKPDTHPSEEDSFAKKRLAPTMSAYIRSIFGAINPAESPMDQIYDHLKGLFIVFERLISVLADHKAYDEIFNECFAVFQEGLNELLTSEAFKVRLDDAECKKFHELFSMYRSTITANKYQDFEECGVKRVFPEILDGFYFSLCKQKAIKLLEKETNDNPTPTLIEIREAKKPEALLNILIRLTAQHDSGPGHFDNREPKLPDRLKGKLGYVRENVRRYPADASALSEDSTVVLYDLGSNSTTPVRRQNSCIIS